MDIIKAIQAFGALSQDTRLQAFRLLVEHGREGASAGMLSDELGIPHNTLSFHLSHLSNAGLVTSRKEGRSVIYKANFDKVESLIGFLTDNCCIREKECGTDCRTQGKTKKQKEKKT
jgi:ArsR family transcriptional regulator